MRACVCAFGVWWRRPDVSGHKNEEAIKELVKDWLTKAGASASMAAVLLALDRGCV
jgi:anaerobic C4-dicarboxylate transporter